MSSGAVSCAQTQVSEKGRRMKKMQEYQCLTCALEIEIDLMDDSGDSDDLAEKAHRAHDGAHQANWCRQDEERITDPFRDREQLGLFHDYYCASYTSHELSGEPFACDCPRADAVQRLEAAEKDAKK